MRNKSLTTISEPSSELKKIFIKNEIEWLNSMGIHAESPTLNLECKNLKCRCKTRKKENEGRVCECDICKEESNPWGDFLYVRSKVIQYMHRKGSSDQRISEDLSMDEQQVYKIRTYDKK